MVIFSAKLEIERRKRITELEKDIVKFGDKKRFAQRKESQGSRT